MSIICILLYVYYSYKPLIITIGVTGVIVWSMLLWTTSLEALMTLEFFYGTYMAAEVAYYTYIYAKVDKKHYPKVTSHTRAAMFAGKLVASISSQLLLSFKVMDYRDLNYITLTSMNTDYCDKYSYCDDKLYFILQHKLLRLCGRLFYQKSTEVYIFIGKHISVISPPKLHRHHSPLRIVMPKMKNQTNYFWLLPLRYYGLISVMLIQI